MQTTPGTNVERGTIVHLRDGLARVAGLPGCMAGEELLLPEGQRGWALQLEPDSVVCAVLERGNRVAVGAPVLGAGRLLHIPCGPALLGALPLERVAAFEVALLDFVRRQHPRVLAALPAVRRVYDREWRDELDPVIAAFQRTLPVN